MYLKAGTEKAGSKRAGSKGGRKGERGREISVISGIWFFHALPAFIFFRMYVRSIKVEEEREVWRKQLFLWLISSKNVELCR